MISPIKKSILVTIALVVVGGSFFAGFFTGISKEQKNIPTQPLPVGIEEGKPENVDFSIFWDAWNTINEKYVSSDGTKDQEKVYGAISGLVKSLGDPYSVFFPPKEAKYFNSEIQGSFEGVGMEIGMTDNILTVVAPLKNTPAEKAGIKAGDKIITIDDTPTANLTVDESVNLIRGKGGTPVKLTIVREKEKEPIEIDVIRGTIEIPTINTIARDDGVFVIELYSFSATSPSLFKDALREFIKSGDNKLVLDLRNNPGGFLEAAVDMASWFLPAGKVVVREDSRSGEEKVYRSKGYNIFNKNLKFVILINQGSASASEILAGALSEYGKATLIGEKSFGKGSVQELVPITKNTSLKITVAKWFTPNKVSISKNGLTPDIKIEYTKEDFEADRDPQLEKAIEILKNM
jgi:carboxyl-terminal processing protease